MNKMIYLLAAVALGAALALQPAINAEVARRMGSVTAAGVLSIGTSFLILCIVLLIIREEFSFKAVLQAPWWIWIGGIIGAAFVVGSMWLAPLLGVALLFACVVLGQLIGAAVIDMFGITGITPRPIDISRLAGIAVVLFGVWLVQRGS